MKASKEFLKKHDIPVTHPDFIGLSQMLANNTGYMLMFTKFRFEQRIELHSLRTLFNTLQENRQILSDLPQPAASYKTYSDLMFDLNGIMGNTEVNKFAQLCSSELKNIIRDNKQHWGDIVNLCTQFNKLDPARRRGFTITLSRHKTFKAVKDALISFMRYVNEGLDMCSVIDIATKQSFCHIRKVDFENNFIILRVASKQAVVNLGRGSSWCIADKNLNNFNSYVPNGHAIQYIIYDFNYTMDMNFHRVAMTNRGNSITNIHDNRNNALNFYDYIRANKYLTSDMFKGNDTESDAENIIDLIGNKAITAQHIAALAALGHIDKILNKEMNASQALKLFGPVLKDQTTTSEQVRTLMVKVLPMIESTKFFNEFIPVLHKLDIETVNTLIKSGLFLKYGVHLDQIIEAYYKDAQSTTVESIINVNGVQYKQVIITTPLNHLDLNVFDLILSTNSEVVTNKALQLAYEVNNFELFKMLLKHYKTKPTNKVRKAYTFNQKYFAEIEKEGLL